MEWASPELRRPRLRLLGPVEVQVGGDRPHDVERRRARIERQDTYSVVTAKVPDDEYKKYADIMDRSAFDIAARENDYRSSGWSGYDPTASAYSAEQIRKERDAYRRV